MLASFPGPGNEARSHVYMIAIATYIPSTPPSRDLRGDSLFSWVSKFGRDWAIARKSLMSLYDRRKFSCWISIWEEIKRYQQTMVVRERWAIFRS